MATTMKKYKDYLKEAIKNKTIKPEEVYKKVPTIIVPGKMGSTYNNKRVKTRKVC